MPKNHQSQKEETFNQKPFSDLRENDYAIIKERPCKIMEITLKKGRHGFYNFVYGLDIITNKKIEDICSSTQVMTIPVVRIHERILMAVDDGYLNLMDPESCEEKNDLKVPDGEMGTRITAALTKDEGTVLVQVISACNEEAVISLRIRADEC